MALRIMNEDGTLHFSELKKLSLSGRQYLYALNTPSEPNSAMLIGTATHFMALGPRPGAKPLVIFDGKVRNGAKWEAFEEANPGTEILTVKEWAIAEQIAAAVKSDPLAIARFTGARFETPFQWEESGIPCSTSGVDITCVGRSWRRGGLSAQSLGDLKTTTTVQPSKWARQIERMHYAEQLVWYRRGARANGIEVDGDLFVLGVETSGPHEVVEFYLTDDDIDLAERSLSLWLGEFRALRDMCPEPTKVTDWPGYTQMPQPLNMSPARYVDLEEEAA